MTNPSTGPIVSARYIFIGEMLHALQCEAGNPHLLVKRRISQLMNVLDHVGLPCPRKSLDEFQEECERRARSSGAVSTELAADLRKFIAPVHDIITGEAEKRLTITLNPGGVSAKLRGLPQQLANLNSAQTSLLAETTRCLECGTNRSAAVMGWNMAFDYIRQWVFDNHRGAFNASLTANYVNKKAGNSIYDSITDYADFLRNDAPGERIVLDACNSAGIVPGNIYEDLKGRLRQRNSYAHPSGKEPTAIQVNAYLEHLVDLITASPFN